MAEDAGKKQPNEKAAASSREISRDEERKIIEEVLAGKTDSYAALVRAYENRIFSLGLRFFRNREDARDFAQEVFVKAFERLSAFRGESRFSTWLMKVAYHHGISAYRLRKDTESLAGDFALPAGEDGPEKLHARGAAREALVKAVGRLPERYRLCVDLYFSFGMTYEDAAAVTNIPVGTVKSHVFRAKQALRAALKDSDAEDFKSGM
ncbi:MAG: sigma-70 family RNA polymerase sigma factor [Spirochaetales bacterium]|nr:sigma-70 family RNA polymerase sigma factor [Spirochaetales bacterium]